MLKKTKIIISVLAVLNILALGVYWYFTVGINSSIEKSVSAEGELNFEVKKEEKLKSTENIVKDTAREREKLDSFFVSGDGVVDFIKEIEELGSTTGASVVVKTVAVVESENEFVETLSFRLEVESSWQSSMRLLSLIEAVPYFISISRYGIERGDEGKWSSEITLNVLKAKIVESK